MTDQTPATTSTDPGATELIEQRNVDEPQKWFGLPKWWPGGAMAKAQKRVDELDDDAKKASAGPDEDAFDKLDGLRSGQLLAVQKQAQQWIAGQTALVTVVATVTLFKGPESFGAVADDSKQTVLFALGFAAGGIALGLLCAYSAAFGSPLWRSSVETLVDDHERSAVAGTALLFKTAMVTDAKYARGFFRLGVLATVIGVVSLLFATTLTWQHPKKQPDSSPCDFLDKLSLQVDAPPQITNGRLTLACKK